MAVPARQDKGICVVTIGCFDLFHCGHSRLLRHCRMEGDRLVAIVHDSESIWTNKKVRVHDSLEDRMRNARKFAHESVPVYTADPTEVLARTVLAEREKGYKVVYMRGNDWKQFPGRKWLDDNGVPVKFHDYTTWVSSSALRAQSSIGGVFPPMVAVQLNHWHLKIVYEPLKAILLVVARLLYPLTSGLLTANRVTLMSLLMIFPVWQAVFAGRYFLAGWLVVVHDMLDRLDGAVAMVQADKRTDADKLFGAFFDAMVDKVFGLCSLATCLYLMYLGGGLSALSTLELGLAVLMVVKWGIQAALFIIRMMDYYWPKSGSVVKARGEGKLATCAENFAGACFLWSLATGSTAMAGGLRLLCACLLFISIDMGSRSFLIKYCNRTHVAQTGAAAP